MGIMKKLLNRTLLYYLLLATILLLLCAPVQYWVTRMLYLDEVNEMILQRRDDFMSKVLPGLKKADIPTWNRFNRDILILNDTTAKEKDKFIEELSLDEAEGEWEPYRFLYSGIRIEESDYVLMIRMNLVETEDIIRATSILYLIILGALLIGFILISKLISSRMWRPFYRALAQIETFDIEKSEVPEFGEASIVEFHQLNRALDRLIRQNVRSFRSQREFTENASHELQTPLAVFQSKLDMLLQDPSLTKEQAALLEQLFTASSRLARVNKNLLLLSRIEADQISGRESLMPEKVLEEALSQLAEYIESRNISVDLHVGEAMEIKANKFLTETLINNLLMNAVRHNEAGGRISIRCKGGQLVICNTGKQKALLPDGLFHRFGKTSENAGGSGLGLALVKKISDLHHWEVNYEFRDGKHCFTVTFLSF